MDKKELFKFLKIFFISYLVITSFFTIKTLLESENGNHIKKTCIQKVGNCSEDPSNEKLVTFVNESEMCRCVDWSTKITPLEEKLKQNYGLSSIFMSAIGSLFLYFIYKK